MKKTTNMTEGVLEKSKLTNNKDKGQLMKAKCDNDNGHVLMDKCDDDD